MYVNYIWMIMQALSLESYFVKSRNGTWWSPAIFQAFHQSKNKLCKRQGISLYDTLISQTMPIPLWSRCKDFTGLIMHILLPKVKSVLVKGILAHYSAICNFWLSNQQVMQKISFNVIHYHIKLYPSYTTGAKTYPALAF